MSVRRLHEGRPDSVLLDEAFIALLARHRASEVAIAYSAYDERPLSEPDAWGDLEAFREAAASS